MPNRDSRRYVSLSSGHLTPLERCEDSVWFSTERREADSWVDQFPRVGKDWDWLFTTITETPLHAYLDTGLARMTQNSGGLWSNYKRAKQTTALYRVSSTFEVALCHRDPAFEDGPSRLRKLASEYEKGLISMPPSLSRLRELDAYEQIDIIVLPPSPLMSNLLRLQLATPALVRHSTMTSIRPEKVR